jgi:hypothetical protein
LAKKAYPHGIAKNLKVVHLSGWCDHAQYLRANDPQGKLVGTRVVRHLAERGFPGPVVLEYLPAFHRWLVPDALGLQKIADQIKGERTGCTPAPGRTTR